MADKSLFEKIADNEIPSHKVWEDDRYVAFLTPWPNTLGLTVVVPKKNEAVYVFDLTDEQIGSLMHAAKKVAKLLEKAFNVSKVGLVFEGEGVAHVHAKLYPMHGLKNGEAVHYNHPITFFPEYPGYIQTGEGPRMSDEELEKVQAKIKAAAEGQGQ
jgi:diadenosine tetraphosphate (Ap4A) HIT family hydrolase